MSEHPFAPLPQHDNIDQCLATDIAVRYFSGAFLNGSQARTSTCSRWLSRSDEEVRGRPTCAEVVGPAYLPLSALGYSVVLISGYMPSHPSSIFR
jgi:hypothetical protein